MRNFFTIEYSISKAFLILYLSLKSHVLFIWIFILKSSHKQVNGFCLHFYSSCGIMSHKNTSQIVAKFDLISELKPRLKGIDFVHFS